MAPPIHTHTQSFMAYA